ncbi:hypothetical protein BDF20DRAFT_971280 [Mycotypha africana]|uniref:uncharacterized protein n=1 Tax=Mycotypha africana TaxID=64632 RepID=UPI0023002B25|nr:uncharacterized protein BDF20DRAFT_971280 [Mycotypha africana]KAI8984088.1 hypothetical protein BDF20DRAFT_971280 [Mycotypha africana]
MNQLEEFHQVFSFKTMGFKSFNDLKTNQETLFRNIVRSDGFTVDFLFSKKGKAKKEKTIENHRLTLEDFDLAEIEAGYRPCFIDPGRKDFFTAAIGLDVEKHQVQSCSTKEYYHMTGSTRYSAKIEKKKAGRIKGIESDMPTAKTGSNAQYRCYAAYILQHSEDLFSFYGDGTAEDRFYLHQGWKRAADKMVNMLINGSTKYNLDLRLKREKNKTRSPRRRIKARWL